jgi:beta-lactamase family protein/uncharacterized protein
MPMNRRLNRRALNAATLAAIGALSLDRVLAQTPSATPASTTLPDTPAGKQLQWVLDVINGVVPMPDEAIIGERFSDDFLAQVPAAQLIGVFAQFAAQSSGLHVLEILGIATPLLIDAAIEDSGEGHSKYVVSIRIEEQPPNKISGLLFQPFSETPLATPSVASWTDVTTALISTGPIMALHAEEITASGAAASIEEMNPRTVLAIGSVFKLYVLGALATQIEQGDLSWDQELTVTDQLKSLPSGVTQTELAGTKLTIEELSRRMISISDNTATDILINAVSRTACEEALITQGNSVPDRNIPFMTTREMFILKFGGDSDILQRYAAKDEAGRREILAEIAAAPLPDLATLSIPTTPLEIERVEWFATAPDISLALAWLWAKGLEPGLEPIREILTINPGVASDPSVWKSVAFKGGSEAGVLAFGWLLERKDGRTFTLTGGVNNPEKALPEEMIIASASSAFSLLAVAP